MRRNDRVCLDIMLCNWKRFVKNSFVQLVMTRVVFIYLLIWNKTEKNKNECVLCSIYYIGDRTESIKMLHEYEFVGWTGERDTGCRDLLKDIDQLKTPANPILEGPFRDWQAQVLVSWVMCQWLFVFTVLQLLIIITALSVGFKKKPLFSKFMKADSFIHI